MKNSTCNLRDGILSITVDGTLTRYRVTGLALIEGESPLLITLRKEDGTVYDMHETHEGWACSCPAGKYRKRTEPYCRHIRSLAALGKIPGMLTQRSPSPFASGSLFAGDGDGPY